MNFFEFGARGDFAGYWPDRVDGRIEDPRIVGGFSQRETLLSEYLGDPPSKPRKKGQFHKSAYGYFFSADAVGLLELGSRGHVIKSRTQIRGREDEEFLQVWVVNFVDCLDLEKTKASPAGGYHKSKIGVIRRPVFDESRWDGSDVFVLPQDPSTGIYCTEEFIRKWRSAGFKGASFSRELMDPSPIRC